MNSEKLKCKGKVLKSSCKHNGCDSVLDKMKMRTHIPTVRCHEEVMSKLSLCVNDDCDGVSDDCHKPKELKKTKNKLREKKSGNLRAYLKSKDLRESCSAPVDNKPREKCTSSIPKTKRSKSISHMAKPNLENSVDFIPVKLLSNNEDENKIKNKQEVSKKQKQNFRLLPEDKSSESCRATWEQLFKAGNQNIGLYHNNIDKEVIQNYNKNNEHDFPTRGTPRTLSNHNHQSSNLSCPKQKHVNYVKPSRTSFFVSDPVKTLDFLIKQLREKLMKQPENDNLQKIILDMENALLKISIENESGLKIMQDENYRYNKSGSSLNSVRKNVCNGDDFKVSNSYTDVNQLQRGLEESCRILQSLCIKQKEKCNNHILEKEQLALQLAESRRLLAIAKSKEKDYEVLIGDLRLKIQETKTIKDQEYHMIQELSDTVAKLREENQMLRISKDSVNKLNVCLKEISSEKEILQLNLHMKELEVEKLKVLLQSFRENQPPTLNNKRNEYHEEYINREVDIKIPLEDKDNSVLSLSTATSWTQEKPGLVCSSQASSSPRHSPSPYNSWQHISSIYHSPSAAMDINNGIIDFYENLKRNMNENLPPQIDLEMPSSGNSFWSDKEEEETNLKNLHLSEETLS